MKNKPNENVKEGLGGCSGSKVFGMQAWGLQFDPQKPCKEEVKDMTAYAYNTGEVEEVEREADLWGSVTKQHTLPSDLQASERQHLANKIELEISLSGQNTYHANRAGLLTSYYKSGRCGSLPIIPYSRGKSRGSLGQLAN